MIGAYTFLIYLSARFSDLDQWCHFILICIGCATVRLYNSMMTLLHTLCMQVFLMIIFSLVVGSVAAGMSGPVSIMFDRLYICLFCCL